MSSTHQLVLPDLMKMCPWSSSTNPHLGTAGPESAAWVDSFGFFQNAKRSQFQDAAAELCAARTYPYASFEDFRTVCDFVNLLFVADETSDDQDGEGAAKTGDTFVRAMKGELSDGSAIVRLTREWKARYDRKKLPNSERRFIKRFSDYLDGVSREAKLRDENRTLDVDQCTLLRREYSGTQTVFALFEFVHGIDLPDAVFEDQTFMAMYWAALDMVNFSNDLYSYKVESMRGLEGNNLLTVLMQADGLDLQEAANKVGKHFQDLVNGFIRNKAQLPSFLSVHGGYNGIDADVGKYVHSLEQWVIGNINWSFETPRYFGSENKVIARTLVVDLPVARRTE